MTVMTSWSVAMVLLLWLGKEDQAVWAWVPLAGGAFLGAPPWAVFATGGMSALMWSQKRERKGPGPMVREALIRFWQEVSVLLTAGLGFWAAVEHASQAEPAVSPLISQVALRITENPHALPPNPGIPGLDGEVTLMLMQHGYLHGLTHAQVEVEVRHMEARLAYEREAKKRRDPLWMTVLPAVLLLNVLWIFVAPMLSMASRSWLKL